MLTGAATTFASQSARDSEALGSHRANLRQWLQRAELANDLEVEKLRRALNPATDAANPHEVFQLELRFLTQDTDQEESNTRFEQFLDQYRAKYDESLPERIFYRLIHECQLSRQEAAVTIRVAQRDYVIFFDSATAHLVMKARVDRSISKEVPLDLSRSVGSDWPPTTLVAAQIPDRRALASLVESFLCNYFRAANRRANMSEPRFVPDDVENRDHDHVGFIVSGVKSQVLTTKNYWEEIEISIDVVQAPSGLKLVCHIDGYYAGGIGSKLPDEDAYEDMRRNYSAQLRSFADYILLKLQKRIETGRQ